MRSPVFRKFLLSASLLLVSEAASAVPISWTLEAIAPTLTPAGIGGTFTYDAETNLLLNWNIHRGTQMDLGTISSGPGCFFPTISCSAIASNGGTLLTFSRGVIFPSFPVADYTEGVILQLATPIPNVGGHTISLIPGSASGRSVYFRQSVLGNFSSTIESGTFTAAVPEPSFGFAIALFLLAIVGGKTLRRRGVGLV